jgi:hypothetical protein
MTEIKKKRVIVWDRKSEQNCEKGKDVGVKVVRYIF